MTDTAVQAAESKFEQALQTLEQAKPFAKSLYQTEVFQRAIDLAHTDEGLDLLKTHAARFDAAGVFSGGPWEDASKLQPGFVGGSLKLKGVNSVVELMSELRMLAIARGEYEHPGVTADEARTFLNEVMALNLNFLFPAETEEARIESGEHLERANRLFRLLSRELSLKAISRKIVEEIDRLTTQRPIMVGRIVNMIRTAEKMLEEDIDADTRSSLEHYVKATGTPTPFSERHSDLRDYGRFLREASEEELLQEAEAFARMMHSTGLVSAYHATFIRHANRKNHDLIAAALGLDDIGRAFLDTQHELVRDMIQVAVTPETCQILYGFAGMLNRGLLSQDALLPSLRRLFEIDIHPDVHKILLSEEHKRSGIGPNAVLLGGTISVLGQPLGVGQGLNPTCQSARAISLWSQHAQNQLLEYIVRAARDNDIDITFEGEVIFSSQLEGGVAEEIHQELDPVSKVLVPHLDKIYNEMMKRTLLRLEDGHKWVNPAFYGEWIQRGFINLVDPLTGAVVNFSAFVKLFYATHHPDYNNGYELIYPNPVGIYITNVSGELLGLHAVSIQRVAKDESGEWRIYFYNPNNDSGQNWGQGIEPSVKGHGEFEGEASLPFAQFVARMYAFHYNPYEQGDTYMVETEIVEEIEKMARESWGVGYTWAL
ncbi:hypothetical protein [Saccharibacillus kuerlensis]|uniref:Uncharacterized protein n=1 Tax=Saccharibacillus kuerlensis TaxID=459527 RepID=A0ABQ2LA25_9BACL|nr:hypothetical protein [Saccharibacillus kuerlensis]GGO07094.1 hypothetical protein GCM10010969_35270 [Saccharibacillus kuerlensis]